MKRVAFDPAKLTGPQADWWREWQKRADEATVAAIGQWERGEEIKFKDAIWGDLKKWLLENVFHGKCAYCETKAPRYPGHAEHFRPKGRVDVIDKITGKPVPVVVEWPDGTVATHPGYFWLAYHWKNLLPACQDCNSGRGKQNQFPLVPPKKHALVAKLSGAEAAKVADRARSSVKFKQRYYLDPDSLDAIEGPQILNPYVDDPRKHLRFGEGGIVTAVDGSEKGKQSIRVYRLDDEALRIDRQKEQDRAALAFTSAFGSQLMLRPPQAPALALDYAVAALGNYSNGDEEYSIAALDYVDILIKQFKAAFTGRGL